MRTCNQEKLISNYAEGGFRPTWINRYRKWKFGKPKHQYYVKNRRSAVKILDEYDRYILENLQSGHTVIHDAAGYYLDPVIPNLTVVELDPIVLSWYPQAIIDTGPDSVQHLLNSANNYIINNTIKLRWKTWDELTEFWCDRRRYFAPGCQIFYSFRDIFIFHNRLKHHFSDMLASWLHTMQPHGFHVVKYEYTPINVNEHITDLKDVPEISDMVNGNVKIHWQYRE